MQNQRPIGHNTHLYISSCIIHFQIYEYENTVKLVESRCCAFRHVVQCGKIIQSLDIFLVSFMFKKGCAIWPLIDQPYGE